MFVRCDFTVDTECKIRKKSTIKLYMDANRRNLLEAMWLSASIVYPHFLYDFRLHRMRIAAENNWNLWSNVLDEIERELDKFIFIYFFEFFHVLRTHFTKNCVPAKEEISLPKKKFAREIHYFFISRETEY